MSLREYHNHASEDEISEDWEEVHDALTQFDFADLDLMKTVSYLEGHMDQVLGAAELRDGSIISWGKDHLLIIWDSHGSYPMDLGHHALVIQGCLNMEGGRGITWSCDHTLKIWDLETMELIRTLKGHGSAVQGALCALEGQYLLSWSDHHDTDGGELLLHDLNNDSCWKLKERGEVNGAIELANGHVLTWGEDDTLRVWDLNCCVEVNTLNTEEETTFGPDGWFASFAIQLKDDRILATLIHGGLIIWDPESDSCTEIDPSITGARQLEDGTILCWSGNGLSIFQPTAPHGIAPLTRTPDTKGVIIMADRLTDGRYIALDDNGVITFWSDGATPELTSVEKTFSKDPKIWGHCVKMANELYARHRWHFHAPTPIRLLHSLQESTLEESALFAAGNRQGRVSLFMPGHPGAVFWEDERRYWFSDSYFLPYYGGQLDEPGDEVFMLVQDLSVDGRLLMTGGRKLRVMELYHGNRRVDLSEAAGLLAAQED